MDAASPLARPSPSPRRLPGLARGVAVAAGWGVVFEACLLLALHLQLGLAMERLVRLARLAEVALATSAVAAVVAAVALVLGRRRLPSGHLGLVAAGVGLGLCLWICIGVLAQPVDPGAVRLTSDLVRRRAPGAAVAAAVVVTLVAASGIAVARRARVRQAGSRAVAISASTLTAVLLLMPPSPPAAPGPDIFLFTVDTLRADHLGVYGYPKATSPAIDALCRSSVVFTRAMAPTPSTVPSYTSIMTGLLPDQHGVYSNYQRAPDALRTVAERLRDAGWTTAAFLDSPLPGTFGNLTQGFDLVVQRGFTVVTPVPCISEVLRSMRGAITTTFAEHLGRDASATTDAAARWLRELPAGVRVFVHFYWPYPHAPYDPPAPYLARVPGPDTAPDLADRIHRYDAEIRFTDAQVGRLLDVIRETGRTGDAWIVLTADHGEELGRVENEHEEPYFGHSIHLFDSSIRVPLCVRPPAAHEVEPRQDRAIVSTASVAATLLEAAGLERSPAMIEPLPITVPGREGGAAFSVARYRGRPLDKVSVRVGEWRLVDERLPHPRVRLLRHAGEEEQEVSPASQPELAARLLEMVRGWDRPHSPADQEDTINVSDRERRMLEKLGYLNLE